MSDIFHKYPHTQHLLWLGNGAPREDKIMSNAEDFLSKRVVVEEKVDGANLGLSLGRDGRVRAQSRGSYLERGRCHKQWDPLWPWLASREHDLAAVLGAKMILFGEWCYARHSIPYQALPDWFLAFDIFDLGDRAFWSVDRRNALTAKSRLFTVPELFRGRLTLHDLPALIRESKLGAPKMEGIYLRQEVDGHLKSRAKVVDTKFIQEIEVHWTRRLVMPNQLGAEAHAQ